MLKRLLWLSAAVFGLLVALFLAWAVYNWIDEAPSPAAVELSLQTPTVPDADNAWVHWVGMGAAEGGDPVQGARAYIRAREADMAQDWADPLPIVDPTQEVHGFDRMCQRCSSCLDHVSKHQAGYHQLILDNALLLQRLRLMLDLREWQPLTSLPLATLQPTAGAANGLHVDSLALQWLEASGVSDREAVLGEAVVFAEFWARVATRPDNAYIAMQAASSIGRVQSLAAEIAVTLDGEMLQEHAPSLRRVLAIAPTINWRAAMAGEHQAFADTLLRQPRSSMGLGLAPQATINAHAELSLAMTDFLATAPGERDAASQRLAAASERYVPPFDEASRIPGYFAYNPVGKILVSMAFLRPQFADRVADMEAMRRMRMLMLLARLENARSDEMPAFLTRHSPDLADPVTLTPFAWDADTQAISYRPLQPEHWEMEILRERVPLQ